MSGPARRPPTWQLAVVALAVGLSLVAGVFVAIGVDPGSADDAATIDAGDTGVTDETSPTTTATTEVTGTTAPLVFEAPPPQAPVETTVPETTTSTTTTAAPTTTASPSTTTTTLVREAARPGPTVETTAGDHDDLRDAMAEARARWDAQDLPRGYVFRTRRSCFCPAADNEVTVGAGGAVVDQRTVAGEAEVDPPTVDDVLDAVDAAIDDDADRIRVSFDAERGYPVEVLVDPDARVADDEVGRRILWFAERGGATGPDRTDGPEG